MRYIQSREGTPNKVYWRVYTQTMKQASGQVNPYLRVRLWELLCEIQYQLLHIRTLSALESRYFR